MIVHDLNETEANKMMTQLLNNKLDVSKEKQPDGKWSLSLPEEQASIAIRYLSEHRMLKEEAPMLSQKGGLMMSKEEQRFRYERALSHEIETTLSNMSGVLQARVHLNLPVIDPIFGQNIDNSKSSASVMLILGNAQIDKAEISALIGGASGIPTSSISVIASSGTEENTKDPEFNSEVIEKASEKNTEKVSAATLDENAFSKIKKTSFLPVLRSYLVLIPWTWIGSALGIALIIAGVFKILNRHEKIVM